MLNQPLCSVIIPAYNCGKFIRETVESVLSQTFSNFEIIVVNDFSTDNTADILNELQSLDERIKILENPYNMGVAQTRNNGVRAASGEYIAFLDADDLWKKDKLEKQFKLVESTSTEFVYTGCDFIDEEGKSVNLKFKVPEQAILNKLLKQNYICQSSVLLKRELALQFPMEKSELIEDFICWVKILRSGVKAYGITEKLVTYRLTKKSRSSKKIKLFKKQYKSLRFLGYGSLKSLFYTIVISLNSIKKYWTRILKR